LSEHKPADSRPLPQASINEPSTSYEWPLHLFKAAVEAAGEAIIVTSSAVDPPGPQIEYVNPAFTRMSGYELDEVIGKTPRILQGPYTNRETMDAIRKALMSGQSFQGEAVNYRKDGSTYLVEWVIAPAKNHENDISHWVAIQSDVTERKKSENALRVSEERLRLIVEGVRDYAIFTTDAEDRIDTWLPGAALAYGWSANEIQGKPSSVLFVPEDRELDVPKREIEEARSTGNASNVRWHLRKDGSRVFIEGSVIALYNPHGDIRGFLKVGQDVTERRVAAEMQSLLMLEVNHRAMNALAVVQAVLKLTPKNDVVAYSEAAEGRVAALARAQMLLTQSRWTGVDLQTLLEAELLPFIGGQPTTFTGPPLVLSPKVTQPLAMVIHELATNATKYGALSVLKGQVLISWTLQKKPDPWIELQWLETGGPEIQSPPNRIGIGTRILTSTVQQQLGGKLEILWNPSGLICKIALPFASTY
jgi:PAS domain S-box-containing protein